MTPLGTLPELFDRSLIDRSEDAAMEYEVASGQLHVLSFGDLEQRSNQWAAMLAERGLVQGDRLGYYLNNCVEIVYLWIACAKLGVIVVPINVLYRDREIRHILEDAEPRAVVTTAAQIAEFPAASTCWDVENLASEASRHDDRRRHVRVDTNTPAALVYTSGTTGAAKGAVLTHGNFVSNALTLTESWAITRADRFLSVLPLFHVHGLGNGLHCWLASGCYMRLVPRFDAQHVVRWFDEFQPTLFFGVPTMYVRLLDIAPEHAGLIGARMRLFVSGSAPLPAHVLEAFRRRFGHVILERYGMTETMMNTSNPYTGERRAGTVGLPLPTVEVRICHEDGGEVVNGTSGELRVRGPNVCHGYWRNPKATETAFQEGWFRTGDIGVRASDGYITLEGRRSDLIISGGFNIYPREIEELLMEQPGIREAAVVGSADDVRGEVPIAYLVSDHPLDTDALKTALRSQVASFKIPKAFLRVESLPRTALGKVQKHLLPGWPAS